MERARSRGERLPRQSNSSCPSVHRGCLTVFGEIGVPVKSPSLKICKLVYPAFSSLVDIQTLDCATHAAAPMLTLLAATLQAMPALPNRVGSTIKNTDKEMEMDIGPRGQQGSRARYHAFAASPMVFPAALATVILSQRSRENILKLFELQVLTTTRHFIQPQYLHLVHVRRPMFFGRMTPQPKHIRIA